MVGRTIILRFGKVVREGELFRIVHISCVSDGSNEAVDTAGTERGTVDVGQKPRLSTE